MLEACKSTKLDALDGSILDDISSSIRSLVVILFYLIYKLIKKNLFWGFSKVKINNDKSIMDN